MIAEELEKKLQTQSSTGALKRSLIATQRKVVHHRNTLRKIANIADRGMRETSQHNMQSISELNLSVDDYTLLEDNF